MSSNKIKFHLELSEKEIPQILNTKIFDSDNRTALGIFKEYDAEKSIAIVELTEEGAKVINAQTISSQN
jgi:hypothetical protein